MNRAAQALGRLARGVPKKYSAAELTERTKRLKQALWVNIPSQRKKLADAARSVAKRRAAARRRALARRKPVNPISDRRRKEKRLWKARERVFLAKPENKTCRCCRIMGVVNPRKATNTHHIYGRVGRLLLWEPGWMACCDFCHPDWIHGLGVALAIKNHIMAGSSFNSFAKAQADYKWDESIRISLERHSQQRAAQTPNSSHAAGKSFASRRAG